MLLECLAFQEECMATLSERHRDEERRKNRMKKGKRSPNAPLEAAKKVAPPAKKHAEKKASYAFEEGRPGKRPSRKSTRKSANRSKADTSFNLTEQQRKDSPEARFRKARTSRARGSGAATTRRPIARAA